MGKPLVALTILGVAAIGMVALAPGPSDAWGGGRVFIGIGPYWGVGPYWGIGPHWGWGYPGPYYGYPYGYPYRYPQATVVEEPRVYIQQPAPPAAAEAHPPAVSGEAAPAETAYWYYCPNSRAYYPSVPACSEPWVRVPARAR